jgi:hypothetical protein
VVAVFAALICMAVALGVRADDPVPQPENDRCATTPLEDAQVSMLDLMRDEDKFGVLAGFVDEVQDVCTEIGVVFKKHGGDPPARWVRPVAQEIVRQRYLRPKNFIVQHQAHFILLLGFETGWTMDPKSTGAAGEHGVTQFIPSTARSGGYDFTRLGGSSASDIRYQVLAAYDWSEKGKNPGFTHQQWTGWRLAEREIGAAR